MTHSAARDTKRSGQLEGSMTQEPKRINHLGIAVKSLEEGLARQVEWQKQLLADSGS